MDARYPMNRERELWACAEQVLRQQGDHADRFLAERVAALAAAGNADGVRTWTAIAERLDRLRDETGADQARH